MLLAQISLQLAQPANATFSPFQNVLSTPPTELDVAVSVLWTLSLVLSLTCALGAILVQDWIQEYLHYSQFHPVPSTRARIRAYLFNGLNQYRLDQVISAIPLLLHLAILLFSAGLTTYFFAFNRIVAYTALVAFSVVGALYLLLSISPLISLSSPFKTPISNLMWRTLQLIRLTALHVTHYSVSVVYHDGIFPRLRLPKMISACQERYRGGIVRALEQDLETISSNTDAYSLQWALSSMQGDSALESFVAAIPRFLDSEPQYYPQYTIGHLLEDRDVRLGWTIGRLLRTCVGPSCTLESRVRRGRIIACARAIWYITEKFAGTGILYWDNLFGAETADSLSTLRNDWDTSVAIFARCAAALAARSCLHELSDVSTWIQTKGPQWTERAEHLVGYISKLSGTELPAEHESAARDGPLLNLGAFLTISTAIPPLSIPEADRNATFMVNRTVKHLVDGVRASEATQNSQRWFSGVFATGNYDRWRRYLDPAVSRAMHHAVASLRQDFPVREDLVVVGAASVYGIPVHQGHEGHGSIPDLRRPNQASNSQWSNDSSRTALSGDATPSPGFVRCHSPLNESQL